MTNAIEVRALRKTFGRTTALDGLDLAVRSGEVHAFLGPNGAGKTTTIRILLGLLRTDGGEASLLGGDPWRDAVALHRRLAYVPGRRDAVAEPDRRRDHRPARQPARRRSTGRRAGRTLIERFDLDPAKKARRLLQGQPAEGGADRGPGQPTPSCCSSTSRRPGLDPLMEAVFRECVDDERQRRPHRAAVQPHPGRGRRRCADRVTIIRDGRTAETGTLAEMRHLTRTTVDAELAGPVVLDGLPGCTRREVRGTTCTARWIPPP